MNYPKISVIVPSYNQGQYLEQNITSLISQNYPNLEILVRDGGSKDSTLDILKRYESKFASLKTGPDGGQARAINDAYREATGEWVTWQNSDDYYQPDTLKNVALVAMENPDCTVLHGTVLRVNEEGMPLVGGYDFKSFNADTVCMNDLCSNQAHFYRKSHLPSGYLVDETLDHSLDHELNLRLIAEGKQFVFSEGIRGVFRYHQESKSATRVHVRCAESFRLGEKYCCDTRLPLHLREGMLRSMRDDCVVGCFSPEAPAFRMRTIKYIKLAGWKKVEWFLVRRFMLSFLPIFHNR